MDGAIYDWALKDLSGGVKREGESILKSCSYTGAVATGDGKGIFAVGSDKTLKVGYCVVEREWVDGDEGGR